MTIGVCDWGIGGLGFYRLLRAARPDLDLVYLGDQGVPGYGKLPRPVLAARVGAVLRTLRERGAERVVVACNAASTALDPADEDVVGMIRPTLEALIRPANETNGPIGILGGRRTVLSGSYAKPLRAAGFDVRNRIAQPLSGLIEAGLAQAPETDAALDAILRPLRDVDRLVLACTHYVVLERAIRERLPNAEIVDPATIVWEGFAKRLPPRMNRKGETRFLTTGDPAAMARTAKAAFDVEGEPEAIRIEASALSRR